MKQYLLTVLGTAAALLFAACDNDIEPIDRRTLGPEQQNPAEYAAYLRTLNEYKASAHFVTYARLDNAPEVSTSPGDFMRALPDSLDLVALARPLSRFDLEDLPAVQRKGTRVLTTADCSDPATAVEAAEAALARMTASSLDGVTVAFRGPATEAAKTAAAAVAAKLAAYSGKTFLFEGNLALAGDAYDLYVLDATALENVYELQNNVDYAMGYLQIPASKLLLAASPEGTLNDTSGREQAAFGLITECVMGYGPLAGLAVYDLAEDYYNNAGNYLRTRSVITQLNPVK
ncbi:glycoside hydrolase family 18 [Alistipes sp.]|uniref:glycoside hydrolase family 18 n=1 Tax=Alistipes sp. TaxID=1872444 RepID=UPI003AF10DC0